MGGLARLTIRLLIPAFYFFRFESGSNYKFLFFPAPLTIRALQGVSAKVIILEEASRLDQNVFYEVIVPL